MNSARIINKYQKKYDKQQERRYEGDDSGFDPHWGCEFFRFCWNEGMRLPSIKDCPGCVSRPEFLSKIPNAYMCVKPSSRNQPRHTMTILIIEYKYLTFEYSQQIIIYYRGG